MYVPETRKLLPHSILDHRTQPLFDLLVVFGMTVYNPVDHTPGRSGLNPKTEGIAANMSLDLKGGRALEALACKTFRRPVIPSKQIYNILIIRRCDDVRDRPLMEIIITDHHGKDAGPVRDIGIIERRRRRSAVVFNKIFRFGHDIKDVIRQVFRLVQKTDKLGQADKAMVDLLHLLKIVAGDNYEREILAISKKVLRNCKPVLPFSKNDVDKKYADGKLVAVDDALASS